MAMPRPRARHIATFSDRDRKFMGTNRARREGPRQVGGSVVQVRVWVREKGSQPLRPGPRSAEATSPWRGLFSWSAKRPLARGPAAGAREARSRLRLAQRMEPL